ncbi:MAG: helix-turn-helix domain-containing protein [Roseburia faecis]
MTQGERIREVRKALGLTLEKFGERIGIKKNSVSQIENGVNNLTEQMTKAICREFHVDYIWLTTGEGDMFLDADDDFKEQIDQIMSSETDARKNLFKFMLTLSEDDVEAMQRLMRKAFEFYKETYNDPEKDNTKG